MQSTSNRFRDTYDATKIKMKKKHGQSSEISRFDRIAFVLRQELRKTTISLELTNAPSPQTKMANAFLSHRRTQTYSVAIPWMQRKL